jgi:hypothetical protein
MDEFVRVVENFTMTTICFLRALVWLLLFFENLEEWNAMGLLRVFLAESSENSNR